MREDILLRARLRVERRSAAEGEILELEPVGVVRELSLCAVEEGFLLDGQFIFQQSSCGHGISLHFFEEHPVVFEVHRFLTEPHTRFTQKASDRAYFPQRFYDDDEAAILIRVAAPPASHHTNISETAHQLRESVIPPTPRNEIEWLTIVVLERNEHCDFETGRRLRHTNLLESLVVVSMITMWG
ncbi:MAG TPA: hypothetical protein VF883_18975, partial [Thermoanaerobaculia bacterium]